MVGDRYYIGVFANQKITAGEELSFNYNSDRYRVFSQPYYCEESNCNRRITDRIGTKRTAISSQSTRFLGPDNFNIKDDSKGKRQLFIKTLEPSYGEPINFRGSTINQIAIQPTGLIERTIINIHKPDLYQGL